MRRSTFSAGFEDAIRHHLNVYQSARGYDPVAAGADRDLTHRLGPIESVLERVDPRLATPIDLSAREFQALVAFVRDGLLDERARRQNLCRLAPASVPSGYPVMRFEACPQQRLSSPASRVCIAPVTGTPDIPLLSSRRYLRVDRQSCGRRFDDASARE